MMDDKSSFGELLTRFRRRNGWTQEKLEEMAGVSAVQIGSLERGRTQTPRRDTVARLAKALGLQDAENILFETAAFGQQSLGRPRISKPDYSPDSIQNIAELANLFPELFRGFDDIPSIGKQAIIDFAKRMQLFRQNSQKVSLVIIIWIPDEINNHMVSQKREELLNQLRSKNHQVYFINEMSSPMASLVAADFIIALVEQDIKCMNDLISSNLSPGIYKHLLLMLPNALKSEYSRFSENNYPEDGFGGTYWYDTAELESCNVVSTALWRVEQRRSYYMKRDDK